MVDKVDDDAGAAALRGRPPVAFSLRMRSEVCGSGSVCQSDSWSRRCTRTNRDRAELRGCSRKSTFTRHVEKRCLFFLRNSMTLLRV